MSAMAETSYSRPAGPAARQRTLELADGYGVEVLEHAPPAGAPPGPPVVYLHGIQSHRGWFTGTARALAESGCRVYQVTRRGSGPCQADRGHARSVGQLLDDLDRAVELARAEAPGGRPALLAVSWGGKLAAAYALDRPGRLASLTLVAPGLAARVGVPAPTRLAIAACAALAPRRLFDIPLNDVALFTDNPDMRRYLEQDAFRLHRATARFLACSALLDRRLARAADGSLAGVPTTLILASRDRIIDDERTRRLVSRLTAGRADVRILEGCHTLEFEPDIAGLSADLARAVRATRQ